MKCAGPWLGLLVALAVTACGGGGGGSGASPEDEGSLAVESIGIEPATVDLARGAETELRVVATLSNGDREIISESSDVAIEWEPLDPEVAEVAVAGTTARVVGRRIGDAVVRAHLADHTAWADIAVSALQVRSALVHLPPGCSAQLTARLLSSDGRTRDVTDDDAIDWSITDDTVASVGPEGRVQAKSPGNVVVRAHRGDANAAARLRVGALRATGGLELVDDGLDAVPAEPFAVSPGSARRLHLIGAFENSEWPDREITDCVAWTSADETAFTVGPEGLVTSVGAENAATTVRARYDDGLSNIRDVELDVLVSEEPVTGLTVTAQSGEDSIHQGAALGLTATVEFAGGKADSDLTGAVDWSSSAPGIARLSEEPDTPRRVFGEAPGAAQLTATLGGFSDSVNIEVVAAPAAPAGLAVSAEPNVLQAGANESSEICARLVANDPDEHVVSPRDIEFTITEGADGAVLDNGMETGSAVVKASGGNGGPACVELHAGAEPGPVTLRAREADSGLEEILNLEIVESFDAVFDTRTSTVDIDDGSGGSPPGARLETMLVNGSNRAFALDEGVITFCNGDEAIEPSKVRLKPDNRIGGGGGVDVSIDLNGAFQDNGLAIALELLDPRMPGNRFRLVHHFTDPPVDCPPAP